MGPEKVVNLRKMAADKKLIVVTVNGAFMECCNVTFTVTNH